MHSHRLHIPRKGKSSNYIVEISNKVTHTLKYLGERDMMYAAYSQMVQ